jgi:hypothetical protein
MLKTIADKILQSVPLSQSKNIFWNSFSNSEKSHILTGDSQCSLDFTLYQESGYRDGCLEEIATNFTHLMEKNDDET